MSLHVQNKLRRDEGKQIDWDLHQRHVATAEAVSHDDHGDRFYLSCLQHACAARQQIKPERKVKCQARAFEDGIEWGCWEG